MARQLGSAAIVIALPMIGFGLLAAWSMPGHGVPPWAIAVFIVFLAAFTFGLVWFVGFSFVSWGVVLSDDGITVYEQSIYRRLVIPIDSRWEDLGLPAVDGTPGPLGKNICFLIRGDAVSLDARQARRVLIDPRYHRRSEIPADIVRRLRLS